MNSKSSIKDKRKSDRNRNIANKAKKNGCVVCGEKRLPCLDFHHKKESDKKYNISDLVQRRKPVKMLTEEIQKCIVICSNCHRMLHHNT